MRGPVVATALPGTAASVNATVSTVARACRIDRRAVTIVPIRSARTRSGFGHSELLTKQVV
ncbi:hypothetical protein GCM10022247_33730 [Allokutzneria multivorans]|uniref:Uncharacterized protein n=1 Tax=Allokutzneria multivorans TaxID=1142134 RepID=A0ABP7S9T3_9PSEU